MRRYCSRPLLSALLLASLSGAAQGQSVSALKGHDRNAPVDVAADRIELQDRSDRAILSGNVEVRQGDMTLAAQRLTVAYSRAGGTEIERLDASGGVRVTSPTETVRSQFAVYDLERRLVTMIGGVVMTRNGNELRGARLTIDLQTGRATMDGSAVGGQPGRVTGRFTVPARKN